MKIRLILIALLSISSASAQNIKSEKLEYSKTILPLLIDIEKPIDLNIIRTTESDVINKLDVLNYPFRNSNYTNNNTSNPKYTVVIDYIYQQPKTLYEKSKTMNNFLIKSNIEAKLYFIEIGKGVFDFEHIILTNKKNQNTFKKNYNEISSTIHENIADSLTASYFQNGIFPNPVKVNEVELDQIYRLNFIALTRIENKLTSYEEADKIVFKYLKKDKNFDDAEFNSIYELTKQNVNPVNKEQLIIARSRYKDELDKYAGNTAKKTIEYKEALLENILTISYLIDDFEQIETYQSLMQFINEKNYEIQWFERAKNKFDKRNEANKLGAPLAYVEIPEYLLTNSQTKGLLNQSGNIEDYKIEKRLISVRAQYMTATINLNNLLYQLRAIQKRGLLPQYENDIFNKIIWTLLRFDYSFNTISKSEKTILKDLNTFSDQLAKEVKDKKIYDARDGQSTKLMKLREYVSQNYKIEDFTKYIPSIEQAISARIEKKNNIATQAYRLAIDMNSIVQMRDLLADDLFMESERKSYEDQLMTLYDDQCKAKLSKNETYYDFKKSIITLENIKNKRSLSEEEYKNYQDLINSVIEQITYGI